MRATSASSIWARYAVAVAAVVAAVVARLLMDPVLGTGFPFATLFFAGWAFPILPGPWWLFLKMLFFLFLFVWLRATLPRLRYDQLMRLSWVVLLPLGLLNIAVTAIAVALLG